MREISFSEAARHGAWILYEACRICAPLGKVDRLADHSEHMAALSVQHPQLRRTQADASFWRAVVERLVGNERRATRFYHAGVRYLDGLERRDAICADAIARYHEVCGDLRSALLVRERELGDITNNGQLLRAAQMQVERCRLLKALNELTQADLTVARESGRFSDLWPEARRPSGATGTPRSVGPAAPRPVSIRFQFGPLTMAPSGRLMDHGNINEPIHLFYLNRSYRPPGRFVGEGWSW